MKKNRPANSGCEKSRTKKHEWAYSYNWNGNHKKVLPFWHQSEGISRSGWRCNECGKFVWDEGDIAFALRFAYGVNMLEQATAHLSKKSQHGQHAEALADYIETLGAHAQQSNHFLAKKFRAWFNSFKYTENLRECINLRTYPLSYCNTPECAGFIANDYSYIKVDLAKHQHAPFIITIDKIDEPYQTLEHAAMELWEKKVKKTYSYDLINEAKNIIKRNKEQK